MSRPCGAAPERERGRCVAGSLEVKAALALARTMRRPAGPLLAWLDQVDRSTRGLCEVPAYLTPDPTAGLAALLAATSAAERPIDPRQARRLAPDLPSRRPLTEANRAHAGLGDRPTIVPAGLAEAARIRDSRSTVPTVPPPSRGRVIDRHALAQLRDAVRRGDSLPPDATTAWREFGVTQARRPGRVDYDPSISDATVTRGLGGPAPRVGAATSVAGADWDGSQRVPLADAAEPSVSRGVDSTSETHPRARMPGATDPVGQAASPGALELPRRTTPRAPPLIPAAFSRHVRDPMDTAIHNEATTRDFVVPIQGPTTGHVVAPAPPRPSSTRLPTAAPVARGAGAIDDSVTAMAEAIWRNGIDPS